MCLPDNTCKATPKINFSHASELPLLVIFPNTGIHLFIIKSPDSNLFSRLMSLWFLPSFSSNLVSPIYRITVIPSLLVRPLPTLWHSPSIMPLWEIVLHTARTLTARTPITITPHCPFFAFRASTSILRIMSPSSTGLTHVTKNVVGT